MADGYLDVEVIGDTRQVDAMLYAFEKAFRSDDLKAFLVDDVYPILQARTRTRFALEGDDVSGPWAQLRPYTVEERRRGGFGPTTPINVRTGAMRSHLIDRPPHAEAHTLGATLWFPKLGGSKSNLMKLAVAQGGSDKPKTQARPVLGVNPNDLELILHATARYLQKYSPGSTVRFL